MAEILIEDLTFTYPGAASPVLEGLSFHVADGHTHALLGGSGAGKTTLLKLLSGLELPQRGRILFDGTEVTHIGGADRGVAQVFQFPVLYETLDVGGNIAFPLLTRGMGRKERIARTTALAEALDLTSALTQPVTALSLFQKQLVCIARALVRPDVQLVLLDEPLTAVEPATKWSLRRALRTLQANTGVTMVYVTHDQTEALTFASQVSVVEGGRILQSAPPDVLMEAPAHEHVGYFIGSPGMQFLEGHVYSGELRIAEQPVAAVRGVTDGPVRVGVRPEWLLLDDNGDGLSAVVEDIRLTGVREGAVQAVVQLTCAGESLLIRARPPETTAVRVRLQRFCLYRDGWRVPHEVAHAA